MLNPSKNTPTIVPKPANGTPTKIQRREKTIVATKENIEKRILKTPRASIR
jgi:hypothetical protein